LSLELEYVHILTLHRTWWTTARSRRKCHQCHSTHPHLGSPTYWGAKWDHQTILDQHYRDWNWRHCATLLNNDIHYNHWIAPILQLCVYSYCCYHWWRPLFIQHNNPDATSR